MNAYFCTVTGVRLVAPGVSKSVDPKSGQDEFKEQPASAVAVSESKPEKGAK